MNAAPLAGSPSAPKPAQGYYQSSGVMLVILMLVASFFVAAVVVTVFGGSQGVADAVAVTIVGVIVLLVLLSHMTYSIQPYEAGLVSIFGSYRGMLRPGFNLVSPLANVRRVDLRTTRQDFRGEEAKTKDGARIQVVGEYYSKIVDAMAATYKVQDSRLATLAVTQSELGRVVHDMSLAEILGDDGEALAARLAQAVNDGVSKWGVKVDAFEIKDMVQLQDRKFGGVQQVAEVALSPLPSGGTSGPQECPYCHTPMEEGTVGAESVTGGAKWHTSRSMLAVGGEPVGDYSAGGMVWLDGYRCRSCGRLILRA